MKNLVQSKMIKLWTTMAAFQNFGPIFFYVMPKMYKI